MELDEIIEFRKLQKELQTVKYELDITKNELKASKDSVKFYKDAFNYAQDHLDRIASYLLGNNWYACDTGNYINTDPIIESTIKERYRDVNIPRGFRYWLGRKLLKIKDE